MMFEFYGKSNMSFNLFSCFLFFFFFKVVVYFGLLKDWIFGKFYFGCDRFRFLEFLSSCYVMLLSLW